MAGSSAAYWPRAAGQYWQSWSGGRRREATVVRLQRSQQDGGASPASLTKLPHPGVVTIRPSSRSCASTFLAVVLATPNSW